MFQARQGDLLIESVESVPKDARVRPSGVLAEGEVTGHAHRVTGSGVVVLERGSDLFIVAPNGGAVVHEEHGTVTLPPGTHRVERQEEYDPYEAAARQVAD